MNFGLDLKANRHALVQAAVEAAEAPTSPISVFKTTSVRGKPCIYYDDYSAVLILRTVARFISRRFRISPPNRDRVVANVIESLGDATPLHVVRRDLKSFYENVPIEKIQDRLLYDTAIPRSVRRHLRAFFEIHCQNSDCGLPRGVGLSAILVELAMNSFDNAVRNIDGVYRYFRYSDDILIFSYKEPTALLNELEKLVSPPLEYNVKKGRCRSFDANHKTKTINEHVDYLGYRFTCPTFGPIDNDKNANPRPVSVSISPEKINRIKSRIILSLKAHKSKPNSTMLLRRMRYLSGNYRISRTPGYFVSEARYVHAGIYFNYKLCGEYREKKIEPGKRNELIALDAFYHSIISGPSSVFKNHLATTLTPKQMSTLRRISFHRGHVDRISAKVPKGVIKQVKSVWRNH